MPNRLLAKFTFAFLAVALPAVSAPVQALELPYPAEFRTREIEANGVTIHVRIGGSGPAIVLIHGFGESGNMWAPLAASLVRNHTVVAHDIGNMVAFAFAEKYPNRVTKLVVIDAPTPGVGPGTRSQRARRLGISVLAGRTWSGS